MERIHLIITPERAELIASAIESADLDAAAESEVRDLAEQAARLRHLAAKARARAARAGTG